MSNFLRNLIGRELERVEVVEPRPVSRFEPPPAVPPVARANSPDDDASDSPAAFGEIEIETESRPPAAARPAAPRQHTPDSSDSPARDDNPTRRHASEPPDRGKRAPDDAAPARVQAVTQTTPPREQPRPLVRRDAPAAAPHDATAETATTVQTSAPAPSQALPAVVPPAITSARAGRQTHSAEDEGRPRPKSQEQASRGETTPSSLGRERPTPPARAAGSTAESVVVTAPRRAAPTRPELSEDGAREGEVRRDARDDPHGRVAPSGHVVPTPTIARPAVSLVEAASGPQRDESPAVPSAPAAKPTRLTVEPSPQPPAARPQRPTPTAAPPNVARPTGPNAARAMQGEAAASAPIINVTIGRVEVRATNAPAAPRRESAPAAPLMSLDDYLRQRAGGGGR
jgi:hypothetical protein